MNTMVSLIVDCRKINPDPEAGRKAVENIVVATRKDLPGKTGLNHKTLTYLDVI